ncbi:MAG: aminoglycoside phosphotransferase family protein [Chloroflexales bacterium]|nr:aminoglycoside phosphotransferase family protein [Chloroflexales bacterium]
MTKMHADERDIPVVLVRNLIDDQFPQWRELTLIRVESSGTDNAIFRLGSDLAVRMPRVISATAHIAKECRWLPVLAPHLPLVTPVPVAQGQASAAYPWPWYVYHWLTGQDVSQTQSLDMVQLAKDLVGWITALQRCDTTSAPLAGDGNFGRGLPLADPDRDARTRACIIQCADLGLIAYTPAIELWQKATHTPAWSVAGVWIHGDLTATNLLCQESRLSAVIDFGGLAVGDPAVDLLPAWNMGTVESRQAFREAIHVDDETWLRGQAWALSVAVIALPYYLHSNPTMVVAAKETIARVLVE